MSTVLRRMIQLKIIFLFILWMTIYCSSVWGYKTKSLVLEGDSWSQGEYQNTFINRDKNLQLTPKVDKVFSVEASVVWDILQDGSKTWVATGSEGKVYAIQNDKVQVHLQFPDKEITSVVKIEDFLYFGSGPEGKIFRVLNPKDVSKNDLSQKKSVWAETGEQFIWDLEKHGNDLWVATGGERGKVFRIPLDQSKDKNETWQTPSLVLAEPNVLKIDFQKIRGIPYLYLSVSTSGKLYRIKVADIGKGKLEVIFDAGEKDIPDFLFLNDDVYLITSGSGGAVNNVAVIEEDNGSSEEILESEDIDLNNLSGKLGEMVDISSVGGSYENFLVKIEQDRKLNFVYRFENKNPIRLIYHKSQHRLYVGVLEDAEIYQVEFAKGSLPRSEKIFFRSLSSLSALYLFKDRIHFTLANQGDIYLLEPRMAFQGEYLSKVFDFKEAVLWGHLIVENHNPSALVKIFTRSGSSQSPVQNESHSKGSSLNPEEFLPITPVMDWSPWSKTDGEIHSPPNRFLQIKLSFTSHSMSRKPFATQPFESDSALIKKVKIFYGKKNVPHKIKSFKIYKQEPNPLLVGSGGAQSQSQDQLSEGLFDVYSADRSLNTTYSTEDKVLIPSLNPNTSLLPFPKIGKKEYVLKWEVENLDKDNLVYTLYYRNYDSSSPETWYKLRDNYLSTMIQLDGYKFIDGIYQFKVVAKDSIQNRKEEVYYDEAMTVQQIFDNKPPVIEQIKWVDDTLSFQVKDIFSTIESVKYSGDRRTVSLVIPQDGVYDEKNEEFKFKVDKGLTELVIIVKDNADNILYDNASKKP